MKFSIDWLNIGDNRAAEIAATICSWQIDLAGINITKFAVRDKDEAPERMITSCYPIADGITRSWWYLFAGTSGHLNLKKYREGFIFPDLTVQPEDGRLGFSATPFRYENPRISFVNGAKEFISKEDGQAILRDFVEQVLHRLKKAGVQGTALAERWDWIMQSTLDADERLFCEAVGAAGLDPYACSEGDSRAIEQAAEVFSHENLLEFLSGENAAFSSSPEAVRDMQWDMSWYKEESKRIGAGAALPGIRDALNDVVPGSDFETPYLRGYLTAQKFRSFIDIAKGQKLPSAMEIARRLGNRNFVFSSRPTHNLRGVVEPHLDSTRVILPLIHREDSKIFALARGVGDYLIFGDTGPAALTDTHSSRQASGWAFAAEFLAPAAELRELKHNGWEEDEIAREFGVGEKVVEYQLKNLSQLA
jgi:hypothetical protein